MTNEQAIQEVKNYGNYPNGLSTECREYIINALEQPCDDCVSRQAVLDKKELIELPDGQSFYSIDPEDVEALPPVTPTQRWIPVSERLPEDKIEELRAKVYAQATTMLSMQEDIASLRKENHNHIVAADKLLKENQQLKQLLEAIEKELTEAHKQSKESADKLPSVSAIAKEWTYKHTLGIIERCKKEYNYE